MKTLATKKPRRALQQKPLAPQAPLSAGAELLAKQLWHELQGDDSGLSFATAQRIAYNFYHYGQHRKPQHPLIRIYTPEQATEGWEADCSVVEIIMEDMPFIIDSAMGAINSLKLSVHRVLHPVIISQRDKAGNLVGIHTTHEPASNGKAESWTHIQCDQIRSAEQMHTLEAALQQAFIDLYAAVTDWQPMVAQAKAVIAEINQHGNSPDPYESNAEVQHFLQWLCDNHFTFLGYRQISLTKKRGELTMSVTPDTGLGILRNPETFVFNNLYALSEQPPDVQRFIQEPRLLFVTKTNLHATVHRTVPMDAVMIKRFNRDGQITGEHLFVGLFTSFSYTRSPREIPLLRHKAAQILAQSGFDKTSHDGKSIIHIMDNYPRDELFQISEAELFGHVMGILSLQVRQQVALFTRHDPFERFVSCLIYIPREYYDSALRNRYKHILQAAFAGSIDDFDVRIDNSPMARLAMIVATHPGQVPPVDVRALEQELRDIARPWIDQLRNQLMADYGNHAGKLLAERYHDAFPADYRAATRPALAVQDIRLLEAMATQPIGINLMPNDSDADADIPADGLHFRIYHRGEPLALSKILPLLENMGLFIILHRGPYVITTTGDAEAIWLHDFIGRLQHNHPHDLISFKALFEDAFQQIWRGMVPDDSFNQLVLRAALPWRTVNLLRSLAKYAHQIKAPQSHTAMVNALAKHARLTYIITSLFELRHTPTNQTKVVAQSEKLWQEAQDLLGNVPNIDEDRILRRFLNLVQASLRTNHYQLTAAGQPKDYLAIKFDCAKIENLPLPRPAYEIFVTSPLVDAVHLRGGKVARGGIRWSDRADDFRTEVLGLMKAQMTKNSVIVPVGAKGGFVVKQSDPANPLASGIAAYKTMMRGLLDITDNQVNGKIVPPLNVVRHDGDDPYLVVAADKGTAKFSDIANGIAHDYGFWLGDAFASGGSVGYDHKHMGITARGAWEAVKRHFRELGKDIQQEAFSCIGVGDMSGDVFGNGMLLSPHTLLLGAFDHRHIFCDPTPDAATSHAERQRLYNLPTSSWADYNAKLISKGGGIFPRSLKSIPLTPQMQAAYDTTATSLSPAELMQTMLRAPVELLYLGGIGTYVKASHERHEDVGDRASEALRVDGNNLRVKVVGEGANLGFTQRGRVEYALAGGKINTDAIDNSAGVDTSDHEVNIKIALDAAVRDGSLTLAGRNKLLTRMTDDVAQLVLRDNYMQTQALSLTEARAAELLGTHARVIRMLERAGLLNRTVEYLPSEDEITERQRVGKGLTRPELAVLLAYAKLWLYQQLLHSDLPDDPFLETELVHYFPALMQTKYLPYIRGHQLRREIIATNVTNSLINHVGIHFVLRMTERTGRSAADVTRAYLLSREAFDLIGLWRDIRKLDNQVNSQVQNEMRLTIYATLRRVVPWVLTHHQGAFKLEQLIPHYRHGVQELAAWVKKNPLQTLLDPTALKFYETFLSQQVPQPLAQQVMELAVLAAAPDLQAQALLSKSTIADVAALYFRIEQDCGFAWLRDHIQALPTPTPWQRDAAIALNVESYAVQRQLAAAILKQKGSYDTRYALWRNQRANGLQGIEQTLQEFRVAPTLDLAMMSVAIGRLAALV